MVVCFNVLFVCFVCFACFVLYGLVGVVGVVGLAGLVGLVGFSCNTLSDFGLFKKKIEALIKLQNKVQRVVYQLVLVTDRLDHSERIYNPSNFGIIHGG